MRLFKDRRGFTGLEAAITLIAFITVAAVFSYILLGAGFFSTQKGQEVVHTGVQQVSSSVEIIGSIIGYGNTTGGYLNGTTLTIQLAAGGQPIDLNKTIITVSSPKHGWSVDLSYNKSNDLNSLNDSADGSHYGVYWVTNVNNPGNPADADNYLEEFEKAQIYIDFEDIYRDLLNEYKNPQLEPNEVFLIEIKPPMGATYPLELKVPPTIDPTMVLLQ
ncbi:flagellin [Archaeoglobus profundus]|uniref:Flagellin n=1 Tax=Archaeoglobus profundus (strain DSM 5631 / JCM 9629 / NBRC 100127 / Av18) TaxID=572546 RepID=D2RE95_ARCPA|nr:flagellin [Archaeoglobus profundus]ADB58439.1 flagellin [Archaeoglobus profundus DSM 5631]